MAWEINEGNDAWAALGDFRILATNSESTDMERQITETSFEKLKDGMKNEDVDKIRSAIDGFLEVDAGIDKSLIEVVTRGNNQMEGFMESLGVPESVVKESLKENPDTRCAQFEASMHTSDNRVDDEGDYDDNVGVIIDEEDDDDVDVPPEPPVIDNEGPANDTETVAPEDVESPTNNDEKPDGDKATVDDSQEEPVEVPTNDNSTISTNVSEEDTVVSDAVGEVDDYREMFEQAGGKTYSDEEIKNTIDKMGDIGALYDAKAQEVGLGDSFRESMANAAEAFRDGDNDKGTQIGRDAIEQVDRVYSERMEKDEEPNDSADKEGFQNNNHRSTSSDSSTNDNKTQYHLDKMEAASEHKDNQTNYYKDPLRNFFDMQEKWHGFRAGVPIDGKMISFADVCGSGLRFLNSNPFETIIIKAIAFVVDAINEKANDVTKEEKDVKPDVEVKSMGIRDDVGVYDNGYAAGSATTEVKGTRQASGGNVDYGKFYGFDTTKDPMRGLSTENMKVYQDGPPVARITKTNSGQMTEIGAMAKDTIAIPGMRLVEFEKNFYVVNPFGGVEASKILNDNNIVERFPQLDVTEGKRNQTTASEMKHLAETQGVSVDELKQEYIERAKESFAERIEKSWDTESARLTDKIQDIKEDIAGLKERMSVVEKVESKFSNSDLSIASNKEKLDDIKTTKDDIQRGLDTAEKRLSDTEKYKDYIDTSKGFVDKTSVDDRFTRATVAEEIASGRAEYVEYIPLDSEYKVDDYRKDFEPVSKEEGNDIEKSNPNNDVDNKNVDNTDTKDVESKNANNEDVDAKNIESKDVDRQEADKAVDKKDVDDNNKDVEKQENKDVENNNESKIDSDNSKEKADTVDAAKSEEQEAKIERQEEDKADKTDKDQESEKATDKGQEQENKDTEKNEQDNKEQVTRPDEDQKNDVENPNPQNEVEQENHNVEKPGEDFDDAQRAIDAGQDGAANDVSTNDEPDNNDASVENPENDTTDAVEKGEADEAANGDVANAEGDAESVELENEAEDSTGEEAAATTSENLDDQIENEEAIDDIAAGAEEEEDIIDAQNEDKHSDDKNEQTELHTPDNEAVVNEAEMVNDRADVDSNNDMNDLVSDFITNNESTVEFSDIVDKAKDENSHSDIPMNLEDLLLNALKSTIEHFATPEVAEMAGKIIDFAENILNLSEWDIVGAITGADNNISDIIDQISEWFGGSAGAVDDILTNEAEIHIPSDLELPTDAEMEAFGQGSADLGTGDVISPSETEGLQSAFDGESAATGVDTPEAVEKIADEIEANMQKSIDDRVDGELPNDIDVNQPGVETNKNIDNVDAGVDDVGGNVSQPENVQNAIDNVAADSAGEAAVEQAAEAAVIEDEAIDSGIEAIAALL